jgi:hypothetical protein
MSDLKREIPWRSIVGVVLFLVFLVWLAGTNNPGLLLGLGILLACFSLLLWRRHRQAMRGVLRDLRPPRKP